MSGPTLHDDIAIMIIKELHRSAPECLRGLRQVSKKIESLVVPFVYNTTTMTPGILTAYASRRGLECTAEHQLQVARDVVKYTRHLVIGQALEEFSMVRLLEAMKRLQSLRWPYWDVGQDIKRESAIVAAIRTQGSSLRTLHVCKLSDDNLEALGKACTHLVELTMEWYKLPDSSSPKREVSPFSTFRKLETLYIFTKFYQNFGLLMLDDSKDSHDAFRSPVKEWVENLIFTKQGTPFEKIVVHGKNKGSASMDELPEHRRLLFLDAVLYTLPVVYTYERALSGLEGTEGISLRRDIHQGGRSAAAGYAMILPE